MRKNAKHVFVALTALLVTASAVAQDKPKLVRGESYVDVPAVGDGLCVDQLVSVYLVTHRGEPTTVDRNGSSR